MDSRNPRPRAWLAFVATVAALLALHVLAVRPWFMTWGATAGELARALPGDEIVPVAASQSTRAITIHAAAADVWPWLAQLGQDRGGFYSFDQLENAVGCEMPADDRPLPDQRAWAPGDRLWMYPPAKAGGAGFATLRTYEPGRALGFATRMVGTPLSEPENGSWSFVLEPVDAGSSRLLARGRGSARSSLVAVAFDSLVFDPMHFVMERRMLEGIAAVAEGRDRGRTANAVHALLWLLLAGIGALQAGRVLAGREWERALAGMVAAAVAFQILTLAQPPLPVAIGIALALGTALLAPAWARHPRRPFGGGVVPVGT